MTAPTEPLKWRKKPVVVDAVRFTGSNHRQVLKFVYPGMSEDGLSGAELMKLPLVIGTLEGDMTAQPGDWIIRGTQGEFYPCKPDAFTATFEPADTPARDDAAELRAALKAAESALDRAGASLLHDNYEQQERVYKELQATHDEVRAALAANEGES